MDKLSNHLESIIKNNGGTPQDWRDIAAIINSRPDEAKNFVNGIKPLLREVPPTQQLIALDLLDFAMVECGLPLHTQFSTKDFITFLLTLLKIKDSPEVQFKILTLIKKWGIRFENKRDILPNFYETYNSLRNNKVVFPDKLNSTYFPYLNQPDKEVCGDVFNPDYHSKFSNMSISELKKESTSPNKQPKQQSNLENNYGNVCLDLNPENYPKKYKKFVSELVTLLNYITLANEMIDNADHTKKSVDEGVREIVSTVRDLDKNLQLAIENQIEHEGLLAICLGINDDIIKLIKRYDDLKAKRKPEPFLSSFHTDYLAYNLNYKEENQVPNNNNYSGVFIDTGKSSISSNLIPEGSVHNTNVNKNANLIDFGFVSQNPSQSNSNINTNISNQSVPKKDNQKMNDINDIFEAFK